MPVINRLADYQADIAAIRQDLHEYPELQYDLPRTTAKVVEHLKSFGIEEITTNIGQSGIVAVIEGKTNISGKTIGLRADMDALPLQETSGVAHSSKTEGKMHACGHDGHTSMLLGAARYLNETRNFDGRVVLIFQPAEEGGGGAKAMIDDGLMDRWEIDEVYGMHNWPGLPLGDFALRDGALMASADRIRIEVEGKGCHAAKPHQGVDTIVVLSAIVQAVQTIPSRNIDPQKPVVISLCKIEAGFTDNVVPQTGSILGTVRTLDPQTRDYAEKRLAEVVERTAELYGATAKLTYHRDYPVTVNHTAEAKKAANIARDIVGADRVSESMVASMGSEDFSFMLQARPGAFIFVGNGDTASLHHPDYDFNDDLLPIGASYWIKLVETSLPKA